MNNHNSQLGGASIFIVIFTALIVTVLTVSFTQLMIRTQKQTFESDLSQRAYDSALAGVEDAKKALATDTVGLNAATQCNDMLGITGSVEQQVGQPNDNQAYTCVKINTAVSMVGPLSAGDGEGKIVPVFSSTTFNRLRIKWFTTDDVASGTTISDTGTTYSPPALPAKAEYGVGGTNVPPILRVTTIPGNSSVSNLSSTTKTVFLYPRTSSVTTTYSLESIRQDGTMATPPLIKCDTTLSATGACSVDLSGFTATTGLYLHVMPIYRASSFTVEALDASSGNPVQLKGLANVDSTGRAGDLFRRVRAQVEQVGGGSLDRPNSALYVKGNLCKTFFATNDIGDFDAGTCTP